MTDLRRPTSLLLTLMLAALALGWSACGKKRGAADKDKPAGKSTAATSDSTPPDPQSEAPPPLQIDATRAQQVLTLIEGMPQGYPRPEAILAVGAHCGDIPGCADPACQKALVVCKTASLDRCGEFLKAECPPFKQVAGTATGGQLGKLVDTWISDQYRRVIEGALGVLPPDQKARLEAARRNQGI